MSIPTLIDSKMLECLGEIAVRTEALGETVNKCIWSIILRDRVVEERKKIGRQVTLDLDLMDRILLLKRLGEILLPDELLVKTSEKKGESAKSEWDRIIGPLKKSANIRNDRIHALWTTVASSTGGVLRTTVTLSMSGSKPSRITGFEADITEVRAHQGRDRDEETVTLEKLKEDSSEIELAEARLSAFLIAHKIVPKGFDY